MTRGEDSPIDRAFGRRAAGDADGALRLAIVALEGQPSQLAMALLIARTLADAKHGVVAGEAAARLVDGFVRRGDLPAAVYAARAAADAGEDASKLLRSIAQAFGKGSKRAKDVAPAPPPLPGAVEVSPALAKLKGPALLDRAEKSLAAFLATDDDLPAESAVPLLPLFGALDPKALEKLLGKLTVREFAPEKSIITQGEEGNEAFIVVRGIAQVVRQSTEGETALAALGPGAVFGEMALVSESPRAASVVAIEPVLVLVAQRPVLEALAKDVPEIGNELAGFCRGRMVANLLRHSAILRAVEPKSREALMARFETRTFAPGESLVKRGEETEGLFLVASGEVRVLGTDADGDKLVLAQLGPGDVVGEISLVLRRPATADVVATHATIALELRREPFHEAIREHPTLLRELYELATQREEETRSVVAQEALDVDDVVLL